MRSKSEQQVLDDLLHKVRLYSQSSVLVKDCHHFLFLPKIGDERAPVKVMLIGFNPGESVEDWQRTCGKRAEESFATSRTSGNQTRSSKVWHSKLNKIGILRHSLAYSQLIFWSSKNERELQGRIGRIYAENPVLMFCAEINKAVIDAIAPSLIISVGLSHTTLISSLYGVEWEETLHSNDGSAGKRIAVIGRYANIPWVASYHFTGARGYTNEDSELLREFLEKLTVL